MCLGVRSEAIYCVTARDGPSPTTIELTNGDKYVCEETFHYIMNLLEEPGPPVTLNPFDL